MPTCSNDIIDDVEKLAKDFLTVSVDFYVDMDDYIFCEMTFDTRYVSLDLLQEDGT